MSEPYEPSKTSPEAAVHTGRLEHVDHESCMTLRASIQWDEPGYGAGGLRQLQTGSDAPELAVHQNSTPPSALLKIRIPVEQRSRGPKIKHALFLLIASGIIKNITLSHNSDGSTPQMSVGGGNTGRDLCRVCLLFELSSRGDLIGPPNSMLHARRTQRPTLESIGLFAQHLAFRIFVNVDDAQKHSLSRLCQALSEHKLGSIDPSNQIAGFYRGQGSQRLDPECDLYDYYNAAPSAARPGEDAEAPPSYNELESALKAPPAFSDDSSRHSGAPYKRKRGSSNTEPGVPNAVDLAVVEALCRKILAEEHVGSQERLHAELSRIKEQLCGQYLPDELSKMEARIGDRLEKKIDEEIGRLRKELSDQHQDLETQVQELDTRVDDRIWCEIDERLTAERICLQDFVKEQLEEAMEDVEDNVKESIRKASFSVEFND